VERSRASGKGAGAATELRAEGSAPSTKLPGKMGSMRALFLEHYQLQTLQASRTRTFIEVNESLQDACHRAGLAEVVDSAARVFSDHAE